MGEEKEGKGFVVRDKRSYLDEEEPEDGAEEEREGPAAAEEEKEAPKEQEREERAEAPPLPEVNFSTFAISLATAAFHHMGLVGGEEEGESPPKDLQLAKHTIDTLAMLEEKTKGNLTKDEESLVNGLLAELRFRYVKLMG